MPPKITTFEEFAQGGGVSVVPQNSISFDEFSNGKPVSVAKPETEPEKLGFVQRVGEDLRKRQTVLEEISDAVSRGETSFAEGVLQTAGKVGVGGVFDLLGESLVSIARGIDVVTPEFIKKPIKELFKAPGTIFLNTKIGQEATDALSKGLDSYSKFAEKNPSTARTVESVVNIALLFAPVKGKAPARQTVIGKGAVVLEKKAIAQVERQQVSSIDDLIRPAETKAVKEAGVLRTTETGIFKTKQVELSASEKAISKEVQKIPGVGKGTLQNNFDIINKEVIKKAQQLEKDIAKNDFNFPKQEFIAELNRAVQRLERNPTIVGDAQKTAMKLVAEMKRRVGEASGKGSSLLKVRKDFDKWLKSQKGTNIFDPKNENALSIALREIRQTTNNFLEAGAKDVGVKESLKSQSTLFRALENIRPKAAIEGANIAIRAWQNVLRVLPFRGEFNQVMAVLLGVGGLGAAAMFAPFFTKIVLGSVATYGISKVLLGVTMKKVLSHLLKGIDDAIRATKDVNLINELRLDRAGIIELLELEEEEKTE